MSNGIAIDKSGPALQSRLPISDYKLKELQVVADEKSEIQKIIYKWTLDNYVDLILTSGGTGFSYLLLYQNN